MKSILLLGALASLQSTPAIRSEPPPDDRFEKRVLARGLARPLELEVDAEGRVFVIEVAGRVSVFEPKTAELRTILELPVFADQENGLIGLALDPDFAQTGWVYLLYSPPDWVGQRLSRFQWDGERLDPTSERPLFQFSEQRRECCHHAGSLEFGPDGCLFIAAGDNTNPFGEAQGYAPIDERPDRFPWDAQRSSANSEVLGGKVLRLRPTPEGFVEIPDGNLFPDGVGGRPEIYVMGCRNPWRIGVDQRTGILYWGEVGPDASEDGPRGPRGYDEINRARAAGFFGWPLCIADNKPYAWVDFETGSVGQRFDPAHPVNRSPNNTGAKVLPPAVPAWIWYPYGDSEEFPEMNPAGGRTACAGPVYYFDPSVESETKLPAWFDRSLFLYEWSRHWIQLVHLDENSDIESITPLPGGFQFKRPVDIDIAPDGTLYLLEYGTTWDANEDSALVRIDYHPGNRPPRALASAQPAVGPAPLRVHLSAAGSVDLDGDELRYRWIGPGGKALGEGAELDVQLDDMGQTVIELEVSDASAATARASVGVLVGNTPPEVRLSAPVDGGFFDAGQALSWTLEVRDEEDGEPGAGDADPEWWFRGTAVSSRFLAGAPPRSGETLEHPALARMRTSDCLNCHAIDQRVVGPAFHEIAARYRGDAQALERSCARVRAGSAEVWGSQPMLAHAQLAPEAIREMVAWVLSLDPHDALDSQQGFHGQIATDASAPSGCWVIDGSYRDGGGAQESVPSLTSKDRVVVRTRRVEAEYLSQRHGTQTLSSASASAGAFIGVVQDGNWLRYEGVDLRGIARVRVSVSSAGAGGFIELRQGSPEAPVMASFRVENNGAWEAWHTLEQALEAPAGKADLFVRFRAGEAPGDLLNLDWLEFLPASTECGHNPPV